MPFQSVELRRYRMKPGRRDDLIAIFDAQFIESQEACGMVPIGHFRDLDDADAFVWLRGFPRFEERAAALHAFYNESDAWRANKEAANDTMIDSDDVLLLRPAREHSGFNLGAVRPSPDAPETTGVFVWISAVMLNAPASETTIRAFEALALPNVSYFVSDARANDFPRLPVREGENAFVACGVGETLDAVQEARELIQARFLPSIVERPLLVDHFRLRPARRSLLR
jgi:hypothetical protein